MATYLPTILPEKQRTKMIKELLKNQELVYKYLIPLKSTKDSPLQQTIKKTELLISILHKELPKEIEFKPSEIEHFSCPTCGNPLKSLFQNREMNYQYSEFINRCPHCNQLLFWDQLVLKRTKMRKTNQNKTEIGIINDYNK